MMEQPKKREPLTVVDLHAAFQSARHDHPGRKGAPAFAKRSVAMRNPSPVETIWLPNGQVLEIRTN